MAAEANIAQMRWRHFAKCNARTNIIYKTKGFSGDKFKFRRSGILMANEVELNPEIMHCKLAKLCELIKEYSFDTVQML